MAEFHSVLKDYEARKALQDARTGPLAQGAAYVRGQFIPLADATVPMFDGGFLKSDLTYDVPAVWNGRYFRLADHIARLQAGCEKMRLTLPMSGDELTEMLIELVRKTGIRDSFVEIIVTRGVAQPGERDPRKATPNIYAYAIPYAWIIPIATHDVGASAVVTRTVRRTPPGAMDPTVKNFQWGDLVRGIFEAGDREAHVPFLPDGDGNITEGAGFNIFTVNDGVFRTPRRGVLEGVTRKTVVEIARRMGHEALIEEVPVELLYSADEIFITSTAGGVMPITKLDGLPIGSGAVGPLTKTVWETYWELHSDDVYSFQIDYRESMAAE
jgi:branched-subunit amino acid aminotransferase/4-amino-4-deoxychorismate lyase